MSKNTIYRHQKNSTNSYISQTTLSHKQLQHSTPCGSEYIVAAVLQTLDASGILFMHHISMQIFTRSLSPRPSPWGRLSQNQPILSFPPACPCAVRIQNAFWQTGVFLAGIHSKNWLLRNGSTTETLLIEIVTYE